MANGISYGEGYLNRLCQEGRLKEVQDYINRLDEDTLRTKLSYCAGPLQYTPLHEAAANGHTSLVDLLVACGADINSRSKGGHTPLHLAAKGGHPEAAQLLLSYKADLGLKDVLGKTAKQVAEASSKDGVVRVLHSEEIVREAEAGCELVAAEESENRRATGNKKLIELLHTSPEGLEADYPYTNQAIVAAVLNDSHLNVGLLANFCADLPKIDNALHFARNLGKEKSHATLLLIKAVLLRDKSALEVLFGERGRPPKARANTAPATRTAFPSPLPRSQSESSCSTSRTSSQEWSLVASSSVVTSHTLDALEDEENLVPVVRALVSKQVSADIALPVALSSNDPFIVGELLWRVGVDRTQETVSWFDLGLTSLSQEWLYMVHWVQVLNLAHNKLKFLPDDIHTILTKVTFLDLQHNNLTAVPPGTLTLPSLMTLNLSHNDLTTIPEVPKWSPGLTTLLLSHNVLTSIPGKPVAHSLSELDLSHNRFSHVPPCMSHMHSLRALDLSFNPIITLPSAMARLKHLSTLHLQGLKLRNVPRHSLNDAQCCVQSISSRQLDARPFHHMRVCVLGKPRRGKSSLVAHLLGRDLSQTPPTSLDVCELEIKPFGKKPLQFSIWDFNGNEALHGMHQCYLSRRTMCVVLFNLKQGMEGVEEVKYWLDSIVSRSSEVCVVVVGTHLDLVADSERSTISDLLREITSLSTKYTNKVSLKHVVTVGLKNRIENVVAVRSAIYRCAMEHHVGGWSLLGEEIPTTYCLLHRYLSGNPRGAGHRYVMTRAEFVAMVQQLKVSDFGVGEEELSGALCFLMDMGCLVHYDSPFYNLQDLYWVDVPWLYSILAKVSCPSRDGAGSIVGLEPLELVEACLVSTEFIVPLLQGAQFPRQYYNQFVALLSLLKVAFPLNSNQIFVPRLLPDAMLERKENEYFRCIRYIAFKDREPVGFWNQLLYQIVWFVPQVRLIFEKLSARRHNMTSELVFPTFPLPEQLEHSHSGPPLNPTDAQLYMWQSGVFYEDRDVTFRVQAIKQLPYQVESLSSPPKLTKEGISVACTCNDSGKRTFVQLIELVDGLLDQWDCDSGSQTVTCPECINKVPGWPLEFGMNQCLAAAASGEQSINCSSNLLKPHSVSLGNLVPELLLLHKLPNTFQSPTELVQGRQLGTEEGIQTSWGHFRGKPVTIRCYSEPLNFRRLSKEATLLRRISHPNIAAFAGISIPARTLLIEGEPLGTLHALLYEDKVPIPRLVVHRMAFQVSSAIRYLHSRGIALRDLKAEGVLVWSLSPQATNHCSVANLERHALCSNIGCSSVRSSSSVPGMSPPEVVRDLSHAGGRCNTSADIFSFAMLFYQVASCVHPYCHLPPDVSVSEAVEAGERPDLHALSSSDAMFFYLSKLLQWCWRGEPHSRPPAEQVEDFTVQTMVHSVMAVVPISGPQSLRCACVTPPVSPHGSHELWVCGESAQGTGVGVYNLDTMTKVCDTFLQDFQVLNINACGRYLWISPRAGDNTVVYNARYRELVTKTPMEFPSCLTCLEDRVYCGTVEGECLMFATNEGYISPASDPDVRCSLDRAVLAMVVCRGLLWVSVEHHLFFLHLNTLTTLSSVPWHEDVVLNHLSISDDGATVWGAHLLGETLSAWDAEAKVHLYTINTREPMQDIARSATGSDVMITAIVPVLDTVWVGMATGHILQFHERELLAWFQPYNDYIRLLVRVPPSHNGPDRTCQAKVISGGKLLNTPLVASCKEYEPVDVVGEAVDSAGTLILWEAFPAEVIRLIRSLEKGHLEENKGRLGGKGGILAPEEGKVVQVLPPPPQTKIEEAPAVTGGPEPDLYEFPYEYWPQSGDAGNLVGRTVPCRILSAQNTDESTPIAESMCDSLYEYMESPFLPLSGRPGNPDVHGRSFLEDTLAESTLVNNRSLHYESRERAVSNADTIYDYPVFPIFTSVSPEHLVSAKPLSLTTKVPPMWAHEVCSISSSTHPLKEAADPVRLPRNDDNSDSVQQLQTESIYSEPNEN